MTTKLRNNEIDIAIALTEGLIASTHRAVCTVGVVLPLFCPAP